MDARVQKVLKAAAWGVRRQNGQCCWCCRGRHSAHEPDCPTVVAQQVLEDQKKKPTKEA